MSIPSEPADLAEAPAPPEPLAAEADAEPDAPVGFSVPDLWVSLPDVGDPGRQGEIVPILSDVGTGVADTVVDFADAAPFAIRGASARGWSHRHAGSPRQDAYAVATTRGWVIAAVADGVSQGRFSHLAAEVASRTSVRLLCQQLNGREASDAQGAIDWSALASEVSGHIVREAFHRRFFRLPSQNEEVDSADPALQMAIRRHMSSTLILGFVASTPDADGRFPACVVNVAGDSAAYVVTDAGFEQVGGGKVNDGSAVTDTSVRPLPGPKQPSEHWLALDAGDGFVLVSDGIGDPFGDGSSLIAAALHPLWRRPPRPGELVEQINFQRRTYDDDRTMVGVWSEPSS